MSGAGFDVLAAGRPSVDIMFSNLERWPEVGRDVAASGLGICAGTSFNTPAALNRLGLRVGYVSMIGNDEWSRMVGREFRSEALPTDFLRVVDRPMPFVSAALNFGEDRGFVSYDEATDADDEELQRYALEVVSQTSARHYHGYAGEEPSELSAMARARGMTVSLDAWDGTYWDEPTSLEELLAPADVVLANEAEAKAMTQEHDVERALRRLAELCPCAVIKRGRHGALGAAGGKVRAVTAEPVEVVDTTGAGDCFNAGFLYGWLAKLPLEDSLALANLCGARAVAGFGGYRGCPREDELRILATSRGIALP